VGRDETDWNHREKQMRTMTKQTRIACLILLGLSAIASTLPAQKVMHKNDDADSVAISITGSVNFDDHNVFVWKKEGIDITRH
jgi:hypothetical protein